MDDPRLLAALASEAVGGVFSRAQWNSSGGDSTQLRHGLDSGIFTRVRKGWFAMPDANTRAVRGVKLGARLTCIDALTAHGAWDTKPVESHLRIPPGRGERSRTASSERREAASPGVVWHRSIDQPQLSKIAVDDVQLALGCALRCLDEDRLVLVVDSLLNRGLLSEQAYGTLSRQAPVRARELLQLVDGRSMSGTETLVRLWLQRRGLEVTPQKWFAGVGQVDLLVDGWLVIECDSKAHHTSAKNYAEDRARDLTLLALGYVVVRLTYEQILNQWADTEKKLLRIVAAAGSRRGFRTP
ncbi:endonuclease domain-containing protein [Pseudoclavibacter helvolus]|uniref:endonuclease domain-containing protein n=2 Tax=Pseudoclavibacter helvolus TaxID=255205 RepID=UPI0008399355|nr:DUF559 domain-containing protein [Pseudoclavibacter helvolus]